VLFKAIRIIITICSLVNTSCLLASDEKLSQTDNAVDLLNLSLEELLNITVTIASRTEQPVSSAPSSVTIYVRQDIQNMGFDNLEDLLNFVPGVYSNRDDVRGQRTIVRGHLTGDCSNGVLVLLNGARGNNARCGGASEHLSYLKLTDVERVEVIRGPGSTMYGSNAMIGVINIITRKTGNEVKLSVGSIGYKEAGIKLTKSFGDIKASIFANYSEDKGDDYEPFYNYFGEFISTKDPRKAVDITGNFNISALTLNTTFIHRKNAEYISSAGGFGDLNDNVHGENKRFSFDLNYALDVSENLDVDLYLNSHFYENVWSSIIIPSGLASQIIWTNGAETDYLGGNTVEGNELQLGISGAWKLSDNHTLSFGSNYRKEKMDRNSFHGNYNNALLFSTNGAVHDPLPERQDNVGFFGGVFGIPFTPNEIYLIDATSRHTYGGYIQSELELSNIISLTTGLRYDDYGDTGSNLSFRGSVVYIPVDGTTIKGMYGQAYRAPSIKEFYGEQVSTGAIGNSDLGAETVDTVEFSVSQIFGATQVSLTWFSNDFEDGIQIVQIDDVVPGTDTFQPQNVGKLKTSGWEAEIYSQLSENFTIKSGISYFDKTDEVGAADTIAFWAFNYHTERWNFNINGYYRGNVLAQKSDADTILIDTTINSYAHWNAKVSYHITDKIEIYGIAENIFDKEYRNYTIISDLPEGVPMRDRIIKIGTNWKF